MLSAPAPNAVKDVSWCWEVEPAEGQMLAAREHGHLAQGKVLDVQQCALRLPHSLP